MGNCPDQLQRNGGGAVLVVDDDASMRSLIQRTLVAAGYVVWTAGGVPDARLLLPTIGPRLDIAIVDAVMPGGVGPELAADIHHECPRARLIYISSYEPAKLRAHGLDVDAAEFLHKPFAPAQLIDALTGSRPSGEGRRA